jgi:hypothetical protein
MRLDQLAPELVLAIFRCCDSTSDVINLSRSCRRIHTLLSSTQKTSILHLAAESEFGPIHDIVQLLTINSSQPAHFVHDPPLSDSLLRQIISVGRVAKRWEEIYPVYKWDSNFINRRALTRDERYRLRRAIYRYWLYCRAFHNPANARTSRRLPQVVVQRARLLHNWSTTELVEIDDFQTVTRAAISNKVCPCDSEVQALWSGCDRMPLRHYSTQVSIVVDDLFYTSRGKIDQRDNDCPFESDGWGDPVTQYYIVEDLLKLDPQAILWLYDHHRKWQVRPYLDSLGEWFVNNGDTFSETLTFLLEGRDSKLEDDAEGTLPGIVHEVQTIGS